MVINDVLWQNKMESGLKIHYFIKYCTYFLGEN